MYKFKIWDKKMPINGVEANVILQDNYQLKIDDVILVYREENPYQIIFMQPAKTKYIEGDTLDMTAQRFINELTEMEEKQATQPVQSTVSFSEAQMEVVNQLIQDAINQAVSQATASLTKEVVVSE